MNYSDIFTMDVSSETKVMTSSKREVDLLVPDPGTIVIQDIGHHLSQVNRYNGGCPFPFSVAQHSLMVSYLLPEGLELEGLLHDPAEAYVGDDVKQKKNVVPGCKGLETRIHKVICDKFGLRWPQSSEVKEADLAIYALELVKLQGWTHKVKRLPDCVKDMTIVPMDWKDVRDAFLARFYQLFYRTREICYNDGELFFSGSAEDAFRALMRYFDLETSAIVMESRIVPYSSRTGFFLRKAA